MTQNNQIQSLTDFVQKATKLGKYNANTGSGLLNAIRAAEKGFSEEEPKEITYLESHIEELFLRQKNLNLSPQSQAVYFDRIRRAIDDFTKYGSDARAIYSWSPKVRARKTNNKKTTSEKEEDIHDNEPVNQKVYNRHDDSVREVNGIKLNIVTWRLRPGLLIKVELPEDLTLQDVEKIKKLLDLEID